MNSCEWLSDDRAIRWTDFLVAWSQLKPYFVSRTTVRASCIEQQTTPSLWVMTGSALRRSLHAHYYCYLVSWSMLFALQSNLSAYARQKRTFHIGPHILYREIEKKWNGDRSANAINFRQDSDLRSSGMDRASPGFRNYYKVFSRARYLTRR